MADLKYTVNKHSEQIDDLQKKSANHETPIETLETQSMATAPAAPAVSPKITVSIPNNIATKDNVTEAAGKALVKQRETIVDTVTKMFDKIHEEERKFRPAPSPGVSDDVLDKVATKAAKEAVKIVENQKYDKAEQIYDHVMNRIHYLVDGAIWAAIPKWFYTIFVVSFFAAIGFVIGFFNMLNQNSQLKEVEWQYRRMRTMYTSDADKQYLVNREKEFFTGSFHVQDSIKNNIRNWEKKSGADNTFTYFAPTEE